MLMFSMPSRMRACAFVAVTTLMHRNRENKKIERKFVHAEDGVRDVLATLKATPSLFKIITNFTMAEFTELYDLFCPFLELNEAQAM